MSLPSSLFLLCGGRSTRMGDYCERVSKTMLPIYDTCPVRRLAKQAIAAKVFREIVISTNTTTYETMAAHFSTLPEVTVSGSDAHKFGSLAALIEAMKRAKTQRFVMCLGDIYFLHNPFTRLGRLSAIDRISLMASKPAYME